MVEYNQPTYTEAHAAASTIPTSFTNETTLTKCDCVAYTYFSLSLILFSVGTITTLLICDESSGISYTNLGHLWLIGPILICLGLTLSMKSMIHLRKKTTMELYRNAILEAQYAPPLTRFVEFSSQIDIDTHIRGMMRTSSVVTLPPAYEQVVPVHIHDVATKKAQYACELPPPSYDEALSLVGGHVETKTAEKSAAEHKPN